MHLHWEIQFYWQCVGRWWCHHLNWWTLERCSGAMWVWHWGTRSLGMVVLGWWLDILEVFPNLYDSVIPKGSATSSMTCFWARAPLVSLRCNSITLLQCFQKYKASLGGALECSNPNVLHPVLHCCRLQEAALWAGRWAYCIGGLISHSPESEHLQPAGLLFPIGEMWWDCSYSWHHVPGDVRGVWLALCQSRSLHRQGSGEGDHSQLQQVSTEQSGHSWEEN